MRHNDAKIEVKDYQGPTRSYECNYDLNLCRHLNPELPRVRDLRFLYFLIRHIFVCGTLFPGIKLNSLYHTKQSCTYKSAILAEIQIYKFAELDVDSITVNLVHTDSC